MLVFQFPIEGASMKALFGTNCWFDDQFIESERAKLEDDTAIEVGGVANADVPLLFEERFYELVGQHLSPIEAHAKAEMRWHRDLLGSFAVTNHNDYGIDDHRHRWLLVLQCGSGYTFRGQGPKGPFEIPLKAGQLIAFDEWEDHEVLIDQTGRAKYRKANYFFTIPNPGLLGIADWDPD